MSDCEFMPQWFNLLSMNAFCVCPHFPVGLKSELDYQVNYPMLFVRNFENNAAWKSLHVLPKPAITVTYMNGHNQFNLAAYNHAKTRMDQSYTSPYRTLPQALPAVRPTAVQSELDHTMIA